MQHEKINAFLGIVLVVALFILASWFVQTNTALVEDIIGTGMQGMLFFVVLTIVTIIFAPVSTLPLIPIASGIWGWQVASLLNLIGWMIGAMIAFWLARTFGVPLVRRLVPLKRLEKIEKRVPQENLFWSVVVLRIIFPVDFLSYALGILSRVKTSLYFWATLVGLTPFAIIWAYLGSISFYEQVLLSSLLIVLAGVLLALVWLVRQKVTKGRRTRISLTSKFFK